MGIISVVNRLGFYIIYLEKPEPKDTFFWLFSGVQQVIILLHKLFIFILMCLQQILIQ